MDQVFLRRRNIVYSVILLSRNMPPWSSTNRETFSIVKMSPGEAEGAGLIDIVGEDKVSSADYRDILPV